MKYTNRFNLPDAFLRAILNDPYSKGESDFSATGLQRPARATVLAERHWAELEIDISTRVATTIGQGVHSILERAARPGIDIIETRYFGEYVLDDVPFIVSAQIDLFEGDTNTLYDWKTTKAFAFHKKAGPKAEWTSQMNIGALLMRRSGLNPIALKIIGILKDWDRNKAKNEPGYPPTEIMTTEIDLWPEGKTEAYIRFKIMNLLEARKELPKCTSAEAWGGRRCQDYCDVASVCDQYKQSKQTGLLNEIPENRS